VVRSIRAGTAHNGVTEWYLQRFSALVVALLLPVAYVMILAVYHGYFDQMRFLDLIDSSLGRTLHTLLMFSLALHAWLGVKVIVEDYVHIAGLRIVVMGAVLTAVTAFGIWWLSVIWAWSS